MTAKQLQIEIDKEQQKIHTDGYSMSINELVSIYREGELYIHPDFQRLYRWTHEQKSRLVDSILLGIPLPSIFVAQRDDGVWEIVDGLQRICTILELFGVLIDPDKGLLPPLKLEGTDYLPSLAGLSFTGTNEDNLLSGPQKLWIKRSKIDLKIILKTSDTAGKFELFQRLNTGGSPLTEQELRNCLIIMLDSDFGEWLGRLQKSENFQGCIALPEKLIKQSFDGELLSRFIAFAFAEPGKSEEIFKVNNMGGFVTPSLVSMVEDPNFDKKKVEEIFSQTFELLNSTTGPDSFCKMKNGEVIRRGFLTAPFEAAAIALGRGLFQGKRLIAKSDFERTVRDLWENKNFLDNQGAGVQIRHRIPMAIDLGLDVFFEKD